MRPAKIPHTSRECLMQIPTLLQIPTFESRLFNSRLFESQKLQFLEMYEKQQEKHGLKGRRASGRPSWRHLVPKVAPKRGQDGQNGLGQGLLRSLVRLYCRSCNFLKCVKKLRKTVVFQGLERIRAPESEPLGPKSRAQEGSGQPKLPRTGPPEGSGHSF